MVLQIIDLENNELFSEIFHEEFPTVNGGKVAPYAFGAAALSISMFAMFMALGVNSVTSDFTNPINENLSQF